MSTLDSWLRYDAAMGAKEQPSRADLMQISCEAPDHINAYFAYFVMEWREVRNMEELHGQDQCGTLRRVPDYVDMLGMDACLAALAEAPRSRGQEGPGGITFWLAGIM